MTVVSGDLVDRPAWEIRDLVASRQVSPLDRCAEFPCP